MKGQEKCNTGVRDLSEASICILFWETEGGRGV